MKVFNNSNVRFAHHELVIGPGLTEIPKAREGSVRELLKKYPAITEVVGDAVTSKGQAAALAAKDRELATLRAQVAKLQDLLTKDPSQMEPKAVANRRADAAEEANKALREEVGTLRAELAALKEPKQG